MSEYEEARSDARCRENDTCVWTRRTVAEHEVFSPACCRPDTFLTKDWALKKRCPYCGKPIEIKEEEAMSVPEGEKPFDRFYHWNLNDLWQYAVGREAEVKRLKGEIEGRQTDLNIIVGDYERENSRLREEVERLKGEMDLLEVRSARLKELEEVTLPIFKGEIVRLREQLRWRKYPEERPEYPTVTFVLTTNGVYLVDKSSYLSGGDRWLPIPPTEKTKGE